MPEFVHDVYPQLVGTRAVMEPVAEALGITTERSIAAIGSMVAQGLSVEEAGTNFNRLLYVIVHPHEEFIRFAVTQGFDFPEEMVRDQGLDGLLQALPPLVMLMVVLGDIRASRAALALRSEMAR